MGAVLRKVRKEKHESDSGSTKSDSSSTDITVPSYDDSL